MGGLILFEGKGYAEGASLIDVRVATLSIPFDFVVVCIGGLLYEGSYLLSCLKEALLEQVSAAMKEDGGEGHVDLHIEVPELWMVCMQMIAGLIPNFTCP